MLRLELPIAVCPVRRSRGRVARWLAAVILGSTTAEAHEAVSLEYRVGEGAEACPDREVLVRSVRDRVGDEALTPDGPRVIYVRVERRDEKFVGIVSARSRAGVPATTRELTSGGACSELIEALALSISVAIAPESLLRPAPPSAPAPPDTAPAIGPGDSHWRGDRAVAAAPRAHGDATAIALSAGLGGVATQGETPSAVPGALAYVAARRGIWGAALEGQVTAWGKADTARGAVASRSTMALASACAHYALAFACATGGAGVVTARGDVRVGRSASAAVAFAGPRLGVAIPFASDRLELRAHVDALLALTRHRLAVDETPVYAYAPGRIAGAVAVGARF